MSPQETLDELNRIHDDEPERAAAGLLTLDPAGLDDGALRTYAFLLNHVLGEKLGRWSEALDRLAPLARRDGASLPVLRHCGVAAHFAGDAAAADAAIARLAAQASVDVAIARDLVKLAALGFKPLAAADAPALGAAAAQACAAAAGPLDASFAATFNNVTTALYYATREAPLTAPLRGALRRGAEAALLFWLRAGAWLEHERAHYLRAKIALRTGEPVSAVNHAERGLAIVAANGDDPIEKCFLLQLLAAGVERAGEAARAQAIRTEVDALATTLDADMRSLLAQDAGEFPARAELPKLAFIGGGNMAAALIGGLRSRHAVGAVHVVEIDPARRAWLECEFLATTGDQPDASVAGCAAVVLAVKPQQMRDVCLALRPHLGDALVLSIAAGIRASDIARWSGSERVVRAMPNTPALIGRGISGLAALPDVSATERTLAGQILAAAGEIVWFDDEAQLDPVTAVSGSGPAYVFYFIEALQQAGHDLGFTEAQARQLAIATFAGAAELAAASDEAVATLRDRVTSKGGTTAAALARMQADDLAAKIVAAVRAADERARQLGSELGRD
jgi:pyrroline-5-carboxylate reductase